MMVSTPQTHLLLLLTCILLYSPCILAATVGVDDTDPAFNYVPPSSWEDVDGSMFDYGGSHKLTEDPAAYAEITYSFTSFSFISAMYPYQIAVIIFVDDATEPVYIDLQDYNVPDTGSGPGTVPHQVLYTSPEMEYGQHTLRIAVPDDEPYAVVDGFEVPDDPGTAAPSSATVTPSTFSSIPVDSSSSLTPQPSPSSSLDSSTLSSTTSTETSQTTSPPPTPSSTDSSRNNRDGSLISAERKANRLRLALAIVGTILGVALIALIWWWIRRRAKREAMSSRSQMSHYPPPTPDTVPPFGRNASSPSSSDARSDTGILQDGRATTVVGGASTMAGLDGRASTTGASDRPGPSAYRSPMTDTDATLTPMLSPLVGFGSSRTGKVPSAWKGQSNATYYKDGTSSVSSPPGYQSARYGDGLDDD
ncbi:hypothetical protein CVT24_007066 [Panaeolus cyanescens]|uniref:Mid2 domain-containing protein n=1 Tax=Panaeolus cyanescens TaxID=181874 RepID=A0A409VJW9_9AGAR|nr:hypothetical protein CVT24_007066 [Panaeolus cyanescens]